MATAVKVPHLRKPELPQTRRGGKPMGPEAMLAFCVGIAVFGSMAATQWVAFRLGFHPNLGRPMLPVGVLPPAVGWGCAVVGAGMMMWYGRTPATRRRAPAGLLLSLLGTAIALGPLYQPFLVVTWFKAYGSVPSYAALFRQAMYAAAVGGGVGVAGVMGLLSRGHSVKASTVHGSSSWGDGDEYRLSEKERREFHLEEKRRRSERVAEALLGREKGQATPAIPFPIIGRHPDGSLMVYRADSHGLTQAPTRSGKGVSFIVPNCLMFRGSLVVADVKSGENYFITARRRRELGQEAAALDPFRETGDHEYQVAFNPLDMVELVGPRARLARDDAAVIAEQLVPEAKGDNKHWSDEARSLWEGLILHVCVVADDARGLADKLDLEAFEAAVADDANAKGDTDVAGALKRALTVAASAAEEEDLDAELAVWDWSTGAPAAEEQEEATAGAEMLAEVAADWSWGDPDPEVTIGVAATGHPASAPPRDLIEARRLLTLPEEEFESLLHSMQRSRHVQVRRCANRLLQKDPKERSGVISSAQSATNWLDSEPMADVLSDAAPNKVDLSLLKKGRLSLYIVLHPDFLTTHGAWLRMMVDSCIRAISRTKGKPKDRVLMIFEEFANCGKMPRVIEALTLRGGFGVGFWLIVQDIGQLKSLYKESWSTIDANTAVKQYFGVEDMETAEYLSKRLGKATVFHTSGSVSRGKSFGKGGAGSLNTSESSSEVGRSLLTPREIQELADHEALLFVTRQKPLLVGKPVYWRDPEFAGAFDRNPLQDAA